MVLDERPRTVRRHAVPYGDGLQTGSLYFIVDRSESRATIHRLLGISLSIAALLFVALVVHVARLLSRTDRQMVASQAALREHKARLAAILDHAPLGIWMSDLDGRCHYLNRRMAVTAGVPDGAPPDPQLAALSGTPGITDCGECPHRDCLRDQAPCRARGVTTDADGQQHELEIVKAPLRNADGGIAGIIGIAIDITEQRRAERAQRLYAQLFEHCGEAILVTDDKVRIVDVNPAFTRLTGYLKAEVLGNNPRMLSSGRTAPEVYGDLWRRLLADGFWQGELWDRRKDGSTYPKWTNIFAIRNDDGAITHYAATFSDISEQKSAQTRIEYLAHHDPLTGLFNRLSLTQRLDQAVLTARRDRLEVALLFVDLDRFKSINDTRGHGVGDHLLIEVAKRLNLCVRESDIVARLGGDEFVVALTHLSCADDARPVVEKIHLSLSAGYVIDGQPLDTSPSIGVARFPSDGETPESLLKSADEAMYRAKSAGRNRVAYFSTPPGGL
jgi:diguanylate cyclase (GGDEF)-like protein/PAS domain S-box-containing protein